MPKQVLPLQTRICRHCGMKIANKQRRHHLNQSLKNIYFQVTRLQQIYDDDPNLPKVLCSSCYLAISEHNSDPESRRIIRKPFNFGFSREGRKNALQELQKEATRKFGSGIFKRIKKQTKCKILPPVKCANCDKRFLKTGIGHTCKKQQPKKLKERNKNMSDLSTLNSLATFIIKLGNCYLSIGNLSVFLHEISLELRN